MRKTIILLILAVTLGAYVYFYEIKGGEERQKEMESADQLFQFERDSVRAIAIRSPQGIFHFVQDADGWQIEHPVRTRADESPLNSLLSSLQNAKKVSSFPIAKGSRDQYGLGDYATLIHLKMNDGRRDSIQIGEQTSIGGNIYASSVDTMVHLVAQTIKTNAEKSLFDWRDKRPLHFTKANVREIILSNRHGHFTFVKEGNDWKITRPVETMAERSTVEAVLNKLDFSRIKSVEAEEAKNLSRFGLARPAYSIDLFLGAEKAKSSIVFSEVKDNVSYGKDAARPFIFTVDSAFVEPFQKDLFAFRDKKIVDFETAKANRIVLSHENQVMIFVKDTLNNWSTVSGEKAKNWKISSLLSSINNLKAEQFVEESPRYFMPYGLVNPENRIEIYAAEERMAELNFGYTKKDLVYVQNPRKKAVVAIREDKLKDLFPDRSELLEETQIIGESVTE